MNSNTTPSGQAAEPMEGQDIVRKFLESVSRFPDAAAFHYVRDGWQTLTYRAFHERVIGAASFFVGAGLKNGDRVAIVSENRPEWCEIYLAVLFAGCVSVPIDAQLGADEIRNLISDSGCTVIFCSQKTIQNVGPAAKMISDSGAGPVRLISFDSDEFDRVLATGRIERFPEPGPDETASIIYTSGTTGTPKGVMLSNRNFCSDAFALISAEVVNHEDNVLAILPLHHTYAFMCTFLVPLFLGASITFAASLKGPDILAAMKERGVSVLIGVPQLLGMIRNGLISKLEALPEPLRFILKRLIAFSGSIRKGTGLNPGRTIFRAAHRAMGERFRFFGSGGARLDPAIMEDLEAFGFTVVEGYGLTETSPVITFNPIDKRKSGSVGRPLPSVELRIDRPDERGEGEIFIKGPMVMQGYYKKPSATADVIEDGWFKTGDIGRIDEEGYLFITGRSKEVIVLSSGKNVYPEDVERLYLDSPLIKEICVTGIEREGMTEALHAIVVPDLEYARNARVSNIQEAVKWEINERSGRMPAYMRVTGFSVRSEPFPRTPLGKLRRFMIKAEAEGVRPTAERKEEKGRPEDETSLKVVEALGHFTKPGQSIGMEDNLELDIGLDSLSKIELAASLEKIFSIRLEDDFLVDVQTVRDLIEKIRKQEVSGARAARAEWREILLKDPVEKDRGSVRIEREKLKIPIRVLHAVLRLSGLILFRLEARGAENIPSDRNYILAPNHASYLDGFVLILSLPSSYFKDLYTLGLREYFTGTVRSYLARLTHVIPIDAASYLHKALQMSSYVIRNGRSLAVFPEGGRSFDGNLMEFKKGVGILAVELGVPVLPVYIDGAFDAMPRGSALPRPHKITIYFGKPLSAADIDFSKKPEGVDDYQYFTETLRKRVMELRPR